MEYERYPQRDRHYGVWHRVKSIARFLGDRQARELTMVDCDSMLFAEHHGGTKLPLCLIEVARDIGQEKHASVTRKLAQMANLPAFVVLYEPANDSNPANPDWPDIERFRVRRLWPCPEHSWRTLTPAQWARALVRIRGWQLRRFQVQEAANDDRY